MLNLPRLQEFCRKTYKIYYETYPWARMCPTLHKMLIHGCEIASKLPLPVAYFAEDANESWHRLYRKNMISHARQDSREHRLKDVITRALYLSDPKFSLVNIQKRMRMSKHNESSSTIQKFIDG